MKKFVTSDSAALEKKWGTWAVENFPAYLYIYTHTHTHTHTLGVRPRDNGTRRVSLSLSLRRGRIRERERQSMRQSRSLSTFKGLLSYIRARGYLFFRNKLCSHTHAHAMHIYSRTHAARRTPQSPVARARAGLSLVYAYR